MGNRCTRMNLEGNKAKIMELEFDYLLGMQRGDFTSITHPIFLSPLYAKILIKLFLSPN